MVLKFRKIFFLLLINFALFKNDKNILKKFQINRTKSIGERAFENLYKYFVYRYSILQVLIVVFFKTREHDFSELNASIFPNLGGIEGVFFFSLITIHFRGNTWDLNERVADRHDFIAIYYRRCTCLLRLLRLVKFSKNHPLSRA